MYSKHQLHLVEAVSRIIQVHWNLVHLYKEKLLLTQVNCHLFFLFAQASLVIFPNAEHNVQPYNLYCMLHMQLLQIRFHADPTPKLHVYE